MYCRSLLCVFNFVGYNMWPWPIFFIPFILKNLNNSIYFTTKILFAYIETRHLLLNFFMCEWLSWCVQAKGQACCRPANTSIPATFNSAVGDAGLAGRWCANFLMRFDRPDSSPRPSLQSCVWIMNVMTLQRDFCNKIESVTN